MAHADAQEGKERGNWRMEWVASTLHTTSEHGVSSITTVDAHTSAASSRLNRRPRRFKWTRPFLRKTKSGFCACAITFQTQSTDTHVIFPPCLFPRPAHMGFVVDIVSLVPGVLRVVPFSPFTTIPSLFTTHIPFATDAAQS